MAGDDVHGFDGSIQHLGGSVRHVEVTRAMKTVAPDAEVLIVVIGDAVGVSRLGHGLVERRVENGHLGDLGEDFHHGPNTHEVGRVMERSEGSAVFDGLEDLVGDDGRSGELLAPVDNPVSHRPQLVQAVQGSVLRGEKGFEDKLDAHLMVGDIHIGDHGFHAAFDVLDPGSGDADALHEPLAEHLFRAHVEKLVLQRRTPTIQNQNFHQCRLLDVGLAIRINNGYGGDGHV
ncbi:MAG: hypothetical protein BWY79_01889 [Actinobacteria bacterium ADurb.Bin444]|nr:MAG: hypothetical protein BWY79_01889 [Actinobacteria bacterium ADurb.Bin444]